MTAALVLAVLAFLAVAGDAPAAPDGSPAAAGESPAAASPPPTAPGAAADAALLEAVRGAAGKTAIWRGTTFPTQLLAARATDAERRAVAQERLRGWITPERLAGRGRAWSDLGFGAEGIPAELYGAVAADLEGLALTPDGRRVLVDPARLSEDDFGPTEGVDPAVSLLMMTGVRPDEPGVAHLADHALDLQRGGGSVPATTDRLLAERAWAEGRANLVACQLLFDGVGAADIVHAPSFDPAGVLQGALVPEAYVSGSPAVQSLLYFIYGEGFAQAAAAARTGGAAAIGRAAASRTSSHDVLHPDRPPIGATVVEPSTAPIPPGFALADRDGLGEQGIVTLVSVATGKDNLGLLTGDGWRGDGVFRYEPTGDPRASGFTVWISRWVSEAEAEDFVYGYGRVLQARFPGVAIAAPGPGRQVVTAGDRVYRIDRSGDTVTVRVAAVREDGLLEQLSARKTSPSRDGGKK